MRTYPVALGALRRQGVFLGRAYIGQTPAQDQAPTPVTFPTVSAVEPGNRTLPMHLIYLLKRRSLAVPTSDGRFDSLLPETKQTWAAIFSTGWPGKDADLSASALAMFANIPMTTVIANVAGWAAAPAKNVIDMSQDPTSAELNDLGEIDGFFGPIVPQEGIGATPDPWYTQPCQDGFFYPTVGYGSIVDYDHMLKANGAFYILYWPRGFGDQIPFEEPFWCSAFAKNPASEKIPLIMQNEIRFPQSVPPQSHNVQGRYGGYSESARAIFWGISTDTPWSDVKLYVPNMRLAEKVLSNYPLPSPFNEYTRQFTEFCLGGLRNLVKVPVDLTEDEIRVWITFSVLANYENMVNSLNSQLKAKARSARQQALAVTIAGIVVGGLVLAAALPSIIASIAGSAFSAINKINAHDFQKQMGDIQEAFQSSDPGFAKEIGNAADYVNRLSGALETAVDKEQVGRIITSPGVSTGLIIGGVATGLAALAFAIFRK